jgi:hypothetical protein
MCSSWHSQLSLFFKASSECRGINTSPLAPPLTQRHGKHGFPLDFMSANKRVRKDNATDAVGNVMGSGVDDASDNAIEDDASSVSVAWIGVISLNMLTFNSDGLSDLTSLEESDELDDMEGQAKEHNSQPLLSKVSKVSKVSKSLLKVLKRGQGTAWLMEA